MPLMTTRFDSALEWASNLHRSQYRKGSEIPYLAHLLAVTALVLEDGGDEDEAIAALLHDAVEDQGGAAILAEIRERYGDRVAEIVQGCTDEREANLTSQERKLRHVEHLRDHGTKSILRVSAADTLHNARAILRDYRQIGDALFDRFNVGRDGTFAYYRAMAAMLGQTYPGSLTEELARTVADLEREVARGRADA
ncbi:MAG TPA: HD domain-containing protein [Chloroflexota bacterium]|nr:HD domain-containing protein [Chloroflexota bacterium]